MSTKTYSVRAAPGCPFDRAQVGGKHFTKYQSVTLNESDLTDEIRQSLLLEITEIELEPQAPIHPVSAESKPQATNDSVADEPQASPTELDAPGEPDVQINTADGIDHAEASQASDVLTQRKREKKHK